MKIEREIQQKIIVCVDEFCQSPTHMVRIAYVLIALLLMAVLSVCPSVYPSVTLVEIHFYRAAWNADAVLR